MQQGTVEQYSRKRGFGFLRVKGQRKLVFFHINDGTEVTLQKGKVVFEPDGPEQPPPDQGDRIVFEGKAGKKGPKATAWAYADSYERLTGRGLWAQ